MDPIDQEFRVSFRYPVHFTTGVFDAANPLLSDVVAAAATAPGAADVVVVVDEGVVDAAPDVPATIEAYCRERGATLRLAGPILIVPGGEQSKNDPRHLDAIHHAIHDARLCRHSYVIAVGGGALLDVVGYAAATAHRGVRLIRVPTTVLAQDDSGVGVKNGINGFGTKNYYGTFAPPFAVINDFDFLDTLSERDWLSGISEAIKVALIRDRAFFDEIEADASRLVGRDRAAMERLVRRSAELHLQHIRGGDPFESGSSRPLDFGHWAAHKLEQLTDHRLRHGEAVAIGVALDSTYSCLTGALAESDWRRITALVRTMGLPIYAPELGEHLDPSDARSVLRGLEEFREHLGGRLTVMLLRSMGEAFNVHEIRTEVMIRSIEVLRQIDAGHAPVSTPEQALASALARGR